MNQFIKYFFTPFVGRERAWRFSIMLKAFGDVFFYKRSFFSEVGWLKAYDQKKPIGNNSEPLPWVTYSFIDFITPRLNKTMNLFEYGSGYSTLYYAKYVNQVTSVEHDKNWYEEVKDQMLDNVHLKFASLDNGDEYTGMPSKDKLEYQVIIVDGRRRNDCMKHAISAISEDGIIVLDDSERKEYVEGKDFLLSKGFKEIAFTGIAPGMFLYKSTSIFYRENNCLEI